MIIVIASSIAAAVGFLYYKRQQEIKTYTQQLATNSSLGQLRSQLKQLQQSAAAQNLPAFQEALATFDFLQNTNKIPAEPILQHAAEALNHYQSLADTYRQLNPQSYLQPQLFYPQHAKDYIQDIQNQLNSLCNEEAIGAADTADKIKNLQNTNLQHSLSQTLELQLNQQSNQLLNPKIISARLVPYLQNLENSPDFQSKLNSCHYSQFWGLPEIIQIRKYLSTLLRLAFELKTQIDSFPESYKKTTEDQAYLDTCEANASEILLSYLPQNIEDTAAPQRLSPADTPSILAQFAKIAYPLPFSKMKTALLAAANMSKLTLKYRPEYTLNSIQQLSLQIIEDLAILDDKFNTGDKTNAFQEISTLYRDFFERERYQTRYLRIDRRN